MNITLGFDVYGTLIDTQGVAVALEKHVGKTALEFSRTWRDKQLEYAFRRGLMQNYENFALCTRQALDYACLYYKLPLSDQQKAELMCAYSVLPAFADVAEGLARVKDAGFQLFAFSNGTAEAVETLLQNAGIRDYFDGVVSVDEVKSFKPDPGVYRHFLSQAGALGADAWLVSSNPFDVIGAISSGMQAAWIKRTPDAIFDPWGIEPTLTAPGLLNLAEHIARQVKSTGS